MVAPPSAELRRQPLHVCYLYTCAEDDIIVEKCAPCHGHQWVTYFCYVCSWSSARGLVHSGCNFTGIFAVSCGSGPGVGSPPRLLPYLSCQEIGSHEKERRKGLSNVPKYLNFKLLKECQDPRGWRAEICISSNIPIASGLIGAEF